MTQSFNTGATAGSGSSQVASQAITIPGGVLAGDALLLVAAGFEGPAAATLSAASTGTAPTLLKQAQSAQFSGLFINGALWGLVAGAGDAGKVITVSISSSGAFWSLALGAWTGFDPVSPFDVFDVATATGQSDISSPSLVTGASGDWAIYAAGVADVSSVLNNPSGVTQREKLITSSGICSALVDSNAGVGPAGTTIGGAGVQWATTTATSWLTAFTVGLKPPAAPSVNSGAFVVFP